MICLHWSSLRTPLTPSRVPWRASVPPRWPLAMVGDMRLVLWWAGSAASIVLVDASLMNESGSCLDSADAAASSCTTTGSGGLILVGQAA